MNAPKPATALGAGLILLVVFAAWIVRRNDPPAVPTPPFQDPAGFEAPRTDSIRPAPNAPAAPSSKAPVVLVVGRLVEPGGFAPIPALLHATRIVPIGAAVKPVVPGDDGGFSFYWPSPGAPVAFEVRTAFHAVLGSRTVVDEAAKRRVDLPAAAEGATLDAGAVPLPASERLSWVEGDVQSSAGFPLEGLAVELVGREEFDGLRLRAVDRALALDHAPNVPSRYAANARFLLRHVKPGFYDLTVSARGHRRKRVELEFPSTAPLAPRILTLDPCARAVAGRIVDAATGTALASAEVRLMDGTRLIGEATSDAAGAFKAWLEEDPTGPDVRIVAALDGFEPAEHPVPAGELPAHREIALSRKP